MSDATCKCGCGRAVWMRGYSRSCYSRWMKLGKPDSIPMPVRFTDKKPTINVGLCIVCGNGKAYARRMCPSCYGRWLRNGKPSDLSTIKIGYCKCGCGSKAKTEGYAPACYKRWLSLGKPETLLPRTKKKRYKKGEPRPICPECGKRPIRCMNKCTACHQRWRMLGRPDVLPPAKIIAPASYTFKCPKCGGYKGNKSSKQCKACLYKSIKAHDEFDRLYPNAKHFGKGYDK